MSWSTFLMKISLLLPLAPSTSLLNGFSLIFSQISPLSMSNIYIAVGNEAFLKDPFYTPYLVPAMMNLYQALQMLNLVASIKLSSPQAASVLSVSYPPSSAAFDPYLQSVMIPLLKFLHDTGSPFMVNVYPYISYINDKEHISLDYALFRNQNVVQDGGFLYANLFDASVDAFVYAMEREGFQGIKIVVSETGWPTGGGEAASVANAMAYNENVNEKNGEEYEKHFGLFGLDGVKIYDININ
ncbi:hypothetical protein POTOM_053093 [Populus tomentosa]|uniref:glucan endo-1,3-beta-D-glucosidase n=1 Tax=Populus tomentosa TaxID=118781 RepID=A0A8X7Y1B0_POPTO|nr:hypothetical protein POTOM_053093 [Populus tomentosa]